MTIKEIIDGLKFSMEMCLYNPTDGSMRPVSTLNDMNKTTYDACEGAIELLKKEPCEDCVSRESVIEWLKDKDIIKMKNQEENARRELDELPSVQPQPKRGKWIKYNVDIVPHPLHCSECGWSNHHLNRTIVSDFKHCPNCGARMDADMRGEEE